MSAHSKLNRAQIAAVIVAALGYFVDVYDLILFSIVRVASLKDLGLADADLLTYGVRVLNSQMAGMLIGGVLWGVWGDKKGRLSVLFGSILMYSSANIANGFVTDVNVYALLRFIAGVGLAGELGAGITLVSELMPKDRRGYATTIVATVGVLGALVAAKVGEMFPWRTSYFIGGGMGLLLLVLRISVRESGMYESVAKSHHLAKGDLTLLFRSRERFTRYVHAILCGVPIWCVLGILITFSPEIGRAMGLTEPVAAGKAVFYGYVGLVLGDLVSGLLSQMLKSRKKVLYAFVSLTGVLSVVYCLWPHTSPTSIYAMAVPLGFAAGYWAVFITSAAEQFGTNLRSTVTTSAPNFVRGATVLMSILFQRLSLSLGAVHAGIAVSVLTSGLALWSVSCLTETFHKDLDFTEG